MKMALSPGDPSSYSRPDLVKTTHIHMDWDINFQAGIGLKAKFLIIIV